MLAEEWVVARGNVGVGGIKHPQLVHAAGRLDGGEKIGEKLLVALAVEDEHGNPVRITGRAGHTKEILGDDVLEQRGLARPSRSKHHRLHDAGRVRPEPGLAMDVVAQNNRILFGGGFDGSAVFGVAYK
jgi:hypothetical protein